MSKRIFISFAIEDVSLKDLLVGQARNENCPFSFTDMSVKKPWDSAWKTNCRTKIKGCDGTIAIITNKTKRADGQLWEMNCSIEESVPILLIKGYRDEQLSLPPSISNKKIHNWSWSTISDWIDKL